MKRLVALMLVSGCYLGAHGSVDSGYHMRPGAKSAPEGGIDLGAGWSGEQQSGGVLATFAESPLVGEGPMTAPPRTTMYLMGGWYEHAFTSTLPGVRAFGRLLFGGNGCSLEKDQPMPSSGCRNPERQRDTAEASTAVGIAFTASKRQEHAEMPDSVTIGLALVYTYASDPLLGSGDFFGIELSIRAGLDVVGALERASKKD